jgi:hypothetical protein
MMEETQSDREARILASDVRLERILSEVVPKGAEVSSRIEDGGLTFNISWPAPARGRPHAHGTVFVKLLREAFHDYLLRDEVKEQAEDRFRKFVTEKTASHVPKPSARSGISPEPEVWSVSRPEVRCL